MKIAPSSESMRGAPDHHVEPGLRRVERNSCELSSDGSNFSLRGSAKGAGGCLGNREAAPRSSAPERVGLGSSTVLTGYLPDKWKVNPTVIPMG